VVGMGLRHECTAREALAVRGVRSAGCIGLILYHLTHLGLHGDSLALGFEELFLLLQVVVFNARSLQL
jgi:hypothetical protein